MERPLRWSGVRFPSPPGPRDTVDERANGVIVAAQPLTVMSIDWKQVSHRIRVLLGAPDERALSVAAQRLNVAEASLRAMLERPLGKFDLRTIAGIVRVYGIDPMWVLTGRYDRATHHRALESTTEEIGTSLEKIASDTTLGEEQRRWP